MKILSACIFFIACSIARADFTVVYDTATGNILEFGLYSPKDKLGNPKIATIQVKETDPILQNPVDTLKYDSVGKVIILKSGSEVSKIQNDKLRATIKVKLEGMLGQKQIKTLLQNEGFDVTAELQAINDSITALKLQYAAVP